MNNDPDPLLGVAEAAARAGIAPSSWRSAVARRYAPPPDDPDADAPKQRRRPRWRTSTVDAYTAHPLGQGRRTDLVAARKEQRRSAAAALAEEGPSTTTALQHWLEANHQVLLRIAGVLVDHREALAGAAPDDTSYQDLIGAIDQAGEAMSARPSRMLATAVTYAQFLVRHTGPVWAAADPEVREMLIRNTRIHQEFNQLRNAVNQA